MIDGADYNELTRPSRWMSEHDPANRRICYIKKVGNCVVIMSHYMNVHHIIHGIKEKATKFSIWL